MYHYYMTDHLGNNRVVVNASGTVIQRNHYYPFGTAFAENTVDEQKQQPYKYNGKELDQMHGLNLYDYSARYYQSAVGRFTTVDPLAEKYYSISPYVYVANNPLKYIDPDGMDIYLIGEDGKITLALKTEDKHDQLVATKKDQYGYTMITNRSLNVDDKEILPAFVGKNDFSFVATSNVNDAFNVFKFASDNSDVEWGLDGYQSTKGGNRYVLRTSFSDEAVGYRHGLYGDEDMIFNMNTHPGGDDTKMASGQISPFGYEGGDMSNLAKRYNNAKSVNKKYPAAYPKHFIYHKNSQSLIYFNDKTTSKLLGPIKSTTQLRKTVLGYKNW